MHPYLACIHKRILTEKNIKRGCFPDGEVLDYRCSGGIVAFEKYLDSMDKEQREKFLRLFDGSDLPDYYEISADGDIKPELGKMYLMYLTQSPYVPEGIYSIIGWQGGLREVDESTYSENIDSIQVKNNFSDGWDALSQLLFD